MNIIKRILGSGLFQALGLSMLTIVFLLGVVSLVLLISIASCDLFESKEDEKEETVAIVPKTNPNKGGIIILSNHAKNKSLYIDFMDESEIKEIVIPCSIR